MRYLEKAISYQTLYGKGKEVETIVQDGLVEHMNMVWFTLRIKSWLI